MNTYIYASSNSLYFMDYMGLSVSVRCRPIGDPDYPGFRAGLARAMGGEHCYIVVVCPPTGIPETHISYLGPVYVVSRGGSHNNDTIYSARGRYRELKVNPPVDEEECLDCKFESCILGMAAGLQATGYRVNNYDAVRGPNSNSFVRRLVEICGGSIEGMGPLTGWDGADSVGF